MKNYSCANGDLMSFFGLRSANQPQGNVPEAKQKHAEYSGVDALEVTVGPTQANEVFHGINGKIPDMFNMMQTYAQDYNQYEIYTRDLQI